MNRFTALPAALICLTWAIPTLLARADTTICQAMQGGYGSFCSNETPGAADGFGINNLPSWISLQKTLISIAVSDDHVWGVDSAGNLWYLANFKSAINWVKVAADVDHISAGHDVVCQLSRTSHVLCSASPNPLASPADKKGYNTIAWIDGGATSIRQIAVSAGKELWAVDAENNLSQIADYTNLAGSTVMVAAGVKQVAVDGTGLLCETDLLDNVYCNKWPIPPSWSDWNGYHPLWGWVVAGKQLRNIAMADGKVYGTDANGIVWFSPDYTNSATWQQIAVGGMDDKLAAGSAESTYPEPAFAPPDVAVATFVYRTLIAPAVRKTAWQCPQWRRWRSFFGICLIGDYSAGKSRLTDAHLA